MSKIDLRAFHLISFDEKANQNERIEINIDDKTIFSSSLSAKGINFVGQLFQNMQQIKKWDELKTEF